MANFFIGLLILVVAILFIKFARQLDNFFAMPTFNFFSSGRQAYTVIGLVLILLSVIVMGGFLDISGSKNKIQGTDNNSSQDSKGIVLP